MPNDLTEARAALLRRLVEAGGSLLEHSDRGFCLTETPELNKLGSLDYVTFRPDHKAADWRVFITHAGRAALRAHDAAQAERVRP